jgi:hypothetical protein
MGDGFGGHDRRYGGKLDSVQRLGRPGLARRVREVRVARVTVRKADAFCPESGHKAEAVARAALAEAEARVGVGRGRPRRVGEPWVEAGISRAEWYRRRAQAAEGDKAQ